MGPAFALALLAGLVVLPAHRQRILTVALVGVVTALLVAALVRVFP